MDAVKRLHSPKKKADAAITAGGRLERQNACCAKYAFTFKVMRISHSRRSSSRLRGAASERDESLLFIAPSSPTDAASSKATLALSFDANGGKIAAALRRNEA